MGDPCKWWVVIPGGLGHGPKLSEQAGCGGHWLICTLSAASSSSLPWALAQFYLRFHLERQQSGIQSHWLYIFPLLNKSQINNESDLLQALCFNDDNKQGKQSWKLYSVWFAGSFLFFCFFWILCSAGWLVVSNTNDTFRVLGHLYLWCICFRCCVGSKTMSCVFKRARITHHLN